MLKIKNICILVTLSISTIVLVACHASEGKDITEINTVESSALSAPAELVSGMVGSTELGFSWTPVEGAVSYLILRDGIEIDEIENMSSFLDEGLDKNTTYVYQIKVSDSNGIWSELSPELTLITAYSDTAPTPPSSLHSMGETEDSIDLMWGISLHESGIEYYKILRDGVEIATTADARYMDTGLKPETIYHYLIKAVATNGEVSIPSNEMVISTMEIGGIGLGQHHD